MSWAWYGLEPLDAMADERLTTRAGATSTQVVRSSWSRAHRCRRGLPERAARTGDVAVVHQPGVDGGDVAKRDVEVTDAQDAVHGARPVDGEREVDLRAAALVEHEDVGAEVAQRVERLLEGRLGGDPDDEDHAGTGSLTRSAACRVSTSALTAGAQVGPRGGTLRTPTPGRSRRRTGRGARRRAGPPAPGTRRSRRAAPRDRQGRRPGRR